MIDTGEDLPDGTEPEWCLEHARDEYHQLEDELGPPTNDGGPTAAWP